ncbi:putative p53 and DNA damage-regulated protein 1 [Hypsibius exemplaris]|uniref:p53 and DNA damage-regulated protein 1 n=1 Tax=Hypsibius exemplaris TaxID=2072580 RepID=A0A1W0X4X5_HYPEX|nr:putative p53 and DNA damage-regulated protein 1 [Hypsibius exemplaris]
MEQLSTADLLKSVETVEKLGDAIIADRHSIIDMDRIRNKNREALGALRRPSPLMQQEEHVWMKIGDIFFRTSKEQLITTLDEDQKYLDAEIKKTRDGLQPKVNELNKALGKPEIQGFHLQPLSKDEMAAVHQMIKPRV